MKNNVPRQCPQTTTFEEKGEPKLNRTKVLLLTSLTPYRWAKPAHVNILILIVGRFYTALFSNFEQTQCTLRILVHAGLFLEFHNPPSSDMNCGIFNVGIWSFCVTCVYTQGISVYSLTRRAFWRHRNRGAEAKPSMWRSPTHVVATPDHGPA